MKNTAAVGDLTKMQQIFTLEEGSPMSDTSALICVVDDDVSVREGVESLIRSAGLRAETFASAQEFLAKPRSEEPNCLVLDVEMPGLNGLDLQAELAKSDVQIPIIFLTGEASGQVFPSLESAPRVAHLKKPIDLDHLNSIVREFIEKYPVD